MHQQKGFTLIELIIVLSILTIILSIATPNFLKFKQKMYLDSERNRLTVSLHFARNFAITNNTHVIVCPSDKGNECDSGSNWHSGWIVFIDKNGNREHDEDEKLLRHENKSLKSIDIRSSIHRSKIRFNSMGYSPGTNTSIHFCDMNNSTIPRSIIINNAGRIKQSNPLSNNVCN